jgi:hypothetical protein
MSTATYEKGLSFRTLMRLVFQSGLPGATELKNTLSRPVYWTLEP